MSMDLTPTTELEAVNAMLRAIGESPVNTVEDNGVVDAVMARQQLRATSRRVQAKGWHWNTDKAFVLPLSFPEGYVKLPINTLKVDTVGKSKGIDVVYRGQRLYDRRKHTYVFSEPLTVDLVSFLPFDDLPETARQFITISATRSYQEGQVGSDALSTFNRRDELMAWSDLVNEEGENADYNIFDEDPTVTEMIRR
jgi:hypothetical protein